MHEPNPTERLLALQSEVFESVARGHALGSTMDTLCRRVEALAPDVVCSVLTADDKGNLRTLAAPSLSRDYCDAVRFARVGPTAGSCGTAMYRGEPVEVVDIAGDPLWEGFAELALKEGLKACWSSPIKARDGKVLASFAFYYREPRGPVAFEREIVATCVNLCALAIEHEETQARNHRLAYYDTLTGLPNRTHFNDMIAQMKTGTLADFGLLLIDVDNLKTVNDTLGHAVGDALIATVGARLDATVADGMPFRVGGDEFAVLLPGCSDAGKLRTIALAILTAMETPETVRDHTFVPSVTVGGVLSGNDGDCIEALRQNADLALYHAKSTRRGGFVRFRSGMRTQIAQRTQVVRDVGGAVGEGRIVPYYQPVIRLDTSEMVGLEALARMRLDDGRIIAAGAFQDAFSDPRLAQRITTQMIDAITADMAEWHAAGVNFQHVGLNITSADVQKGDLAGRIARACDRTGVPVSSIVIEVTEKVFMGSRGDGVARTLEALRERGMPIALDDFGTGFASLTHLLDFPVDLIKIDRSFVNRITTAPRNLAIVEALIGIAARLKMRIVAEGIEEQEQADMLTGLGCRLGQGYLYSRPVPASVARQMLERFGQKQPAEMPRLAASAA